MDLISTEKNIEKAILVGVITGTQTRSQVAEYLDELEFLAMTAGAETKAKFTQKLDYPEPRTYVAKGKLEEIAAYIIDQEIDLVIVDDELSPSQFRNLEKTLKIKILDRTNLILDIFAKRAQTAHSKIQVELAQLQYMYPRLVGMWSHLERQQGGIGMRGPGEREIETDRRIIKDKISLLKDRLEKIDKQMAVQRGNRGALVRVALCGYTNVGKSTLMNTLCKTEVFAENKLFATLDTTVRKLVIGNLPFLLSDTVGFIRKLPTNLVESFKSTLDEVREADVLLHVVDISHPEFEHHIEVVEKTFAEINAGNIPVIMVFNKIDAFKYTPKDEDDLTPIEKHNLSLKDLEIALNEKYKDCLFISAKNKENIEEFKALVYDRVKEIHTRRFPYDNFLYSDYESIKE